MSKAPGMNVIGSLRHVYHAVVLLILCAHAARAEAALEFPPDANLINVRTFGARGDGTHDDTRAFEKAFDKAVRAKAGGNRVILIPPGTYLISNPLSYSDVPGLACRVIVHGSGAQQTMVKLKDAAPAFQDAAKPQPLWSVFTGKTTNEAFLVQIDDLTIDIGRGNPGAIGLKFVANNVGGLRNVRIVSSDADGRGAIGLDLTTGWVGPALFDHVSIRGFDRGIVTSSDQYGVTFKDLTLEGQRVLGIDNPLNSLAIDGLKSRNRVPAMKVGWNGFVAFARGELIAPEGAANPAIIVALRGVLHMVDVVIRGYRAPASDAHETRIGVGAPSSLLIANGVMSKTAVKFDLPRFSFEAPLDGPPADWARPRRTTAQAIQQAFDSGAATIYFPQDRYSLAEPIRIPPSVRHIIGFGAQLGLDKEFPPDKPVITIEERTDSLLLEELDFFTGAPLSTVWIRNRATAPIMIRDTLFDGIGYDGGTPEAVPSKAPHVYLLNVGGIKQLRALNQTLAAWQLNPEGDGTKMSLDSSKLTVYGLKTEGAGGVLQAQHSAATIFGGELFVNSEISPKQAAFDFIDSKACISIAEVSNFPAGITHPEYTILMGSAAEGRVYRRVAEFPRHGTGPVFPGICGP